MNLWVFRPTYALYFFISSKKKQHTHTRTHSVNVWNCMPDNLATVDKFFIAHSMHSLKQIFVFVYDEHWTLWFELVKVWNKDGKQRIVKSKIFKYFQMLRKISLSFVYRWKRDVCDIFAITFCILITIVKDLCIHMNIVILIFSAKHVVCTTNINY